MAEAIVELLFFDTFAHESTEEINLDLVQFPKPVYLTEVRIIPLGARVQADFPGGVRLGATNPSQFQIELFVNDLGKPGASTFETLGAFDYDQNGKIHLDCTALNNEETILRKIPTDGLVLKGLYTTITLAVYGTLTKNLTEQLIQPIVNPTIPSQPNTITEAQQIISTSTTEPEWPQENVAQKPPTTEYQASPNFQTYGHPSSGVYQAQTTPQSSSEYAEYYNEAPKDPRSYHRSPEASAEWDKNSRSKDGDSINRERSREVYQENKDRRYSRSESRDRERSSGKEYHDTNNRDWDNSQQHDREKPRERRHEETYRRSERYRGGGDERDDRKRPRTPPAMMSPKRTHSPISNDQKNIEMLSSEIVNKGEQHSIIEDVKIEEKNNKVIEGVENAKETNASANEETNNAPMDVEEFEPILSDEDILDDNDQYHDNEYDYSAYTNNDDIIRQFSPGNTELKKYHSSRKFTINKDSKEIEIEENLQTIIGIADDYLKSSITEYEINSFSQLNTEFKEEYVHLCEKFVSIVGEPAAFEDIINIFNETREIMNNNQLTPENADLVNQITFIIETITEWLKIGLDFEMANYQDQPAYKIRHIKCGVRLTELLCHSNEYLQYVWNNKMFNIHEKLLSLYHENFMALSIKLMILKALDTYLWHKFTIEKFLLIISSETNNSNGYKIIVEDIKKNPLVREKFALSSILKKLNLYEILSKMQNILIKFQTTSSVQEETAEEINLITKALNQILNYCYSESFSISQPKRFLPVASQFEIIRNENRENILIRYFKMFNLLDGFLILLTSSSTLNLPAIKTPIFQIISYLLDCEEGMQYLSKNYETINILLKFLLRSDEDECYNNNVDSYNLGLTIAYKIQCLYHVEFLMDNGKKWNYDCDSVELIDHLHNMFCLTFSNVGKFAVGEILSMGENIKCLLQFLIETSGKLKFELQKLKVLPGVAYILDLLYIPIVIVGDIKFIERYGQKLNELSNLFQQEGNKANEMKFYLQPALENLSYDNCAKFVNIIDSHIANVISHPGSLITSLRILKYLGISTNSNKNPIISENPLSNYIELKYKHVILQLYSLDGITILLKLLQKLFKHFEQPAVHSSIFISNQGLILVNIIHPTVVLINKMLGYVIQCRNTNFKDLTAIPTLLKTYNLLNNFPVNSAAKSRAEKCKICIIETLLMYTQSVSEEIHEKDSLTKTLWSQMIGEILRYITSAPYTFISGLLILSELLPLPLPIHTLDDLTKDEINWMINLRKLWAAHLLPHSGILQDTLNKICISSQPQLLNLVRRISIQVSDLAANSALIITKGFLDTIHEAYKGNSTTNLARLLNFLACLVTHSTIKCAILNLIQTNDDKYTNLFIVSFKQILKLNNDTANNSHHHVVQSQECILSIIQNLCDVELSLLQHSPITDETNDGKIIVQSETYLANALPKKEILLSFINMIIDHLIMENSFITYLPIVRTLLLLTDHDYGFYYLRESVLKREKLFHTMLDQLVLKFSKTSAECLSTLNTLIEFLRISLIIEETNADLSYNPRSIKFNVQEVRNLIGWNGGEEENLNHPLVVLEQKLKIVSEEDHSFETILESLSVFLKKIRELPEEIDPSDIKQFEEILLPAPETLLTQYSCRIVFSSSDACDERLTDRYWLIIPVLEEGAEGELETVPCDLFEICRQLPSEFNLIKEVEKLCRISRTDPPIDKIIIHHTTEEHQRTKIRKPFVTPMRPRGFLRTTPQRPDLFRSRPPNTSRPPSLHVDDFVALETCGAQPTGPTGYNKLSREILASTRMARGSRGRAFVTAERSMQYNRQMPWWGNSSMGRSPYF